MEHIEYHHLVVDESMPREVVNGRMRAHVPRENIVRMEIHRTTAAERPIVQIMLGIAMLGVLYIPITSFLNWAEDGGVLHYETLAIVTLPAMLGAWLLLTALRRRVVLRVFTHHGARKLIIGNHADPDELDALAHRLSSAIGLPVHNMVHPEVRARIVSADPPPVSTGRNEAWIVARAEAVETHRILIFAPRGLTSRPRQ